MIDKKRGLGRSLGDLLGSSEWLQKNDIQLFYCPVENLEPNPFQPRRTLHDLELENLAESIKQNGVLQPILVTRADTPDTYRIIAGERRWQATKMAGLSEIPVIVREATSPETLQIAIIENIQRRDLNCLEEALAYQRLQEEFQFTQEAIAEQVGKNRSTVANLLRLLQLPPEIQEDILNDRLTMGHARALLSLSTPEEQRKARDIVLARHLSVRQTEQLVSRGSLENPPKPQPEPYLVNLQDSLQALLGTKVRLRRRGKKGNITIAFETSEQLEELVKRLGLQTGD